MSITSDVIQISGGFQWTDPMSAFGELSGLVLESSIIAIICFIVAAVFIYLYYKKFYSVGEAPKGWLYFFIGLTLSGIYQILKIPFTYQWIYGDIFVLIFLIFQVAVVAILVYGLYLLKKEVELK